MLSFTKCHGLGNDFVLIDQRKQKRPQLLSRAQMRLISDRKRGVGFDQLLILRRSSNKKIDAKLLIYNADGSLAEMCGNGLRAAANHLWWTGEKKIEIQFETTAGLRSARLIQKALTAESESVIETEMGTPLLSAIPKKLRFDKNHAPVIVNVGNPHIVYFRKKLLTAAKLTQEGSSIECHDAFPQRINVEFAVVRSAHAVDAQVWERGVGITEACGTGGVAVAVAAIEKGLCRSPVTVRFPGGKIQVRWNGQESAAFLTGTAAQSFEGVILIS